MILHHEVIQAAGAGIFGLIAWGCLGINAAVYYTRRLVRWVRTRGK